MDKPETEFKDEAQETYLGLSLGTKTPGLGLGHLGHAAGAKGGGTDKVTLPGSPPRPGLKRGTYFHTARAKGASAGTNENSICDTQGTRLPSRG